MTTRSNSTHGGTLLFKLWRNLSPILSRNLSNVLADATSTVINSQLDTELRSDNIQRISGVIDFFASSDIAKHLLAANGFLLTTNLCDWCDRQAAAGSPNRPSPSRSIQKTPHEKTKNE